MVFWTSLICSFLIHENNLKESLNEKFHQLKRFVYMQLHMIEEEFLCLKAYLYTYTMPLNDSIFNT